MTHFHFQMEIQIEFWNVAFLSDSIISWYEMIKADLYWAPGCTGKAIELSLKRIELELSFTPEFTLQDLSDVAFACQNIYLN